MTATATLKDTLNRAAKLDVDAGAVDDFEAAVRRLHGHSVRVIAGPEVARSAPHQVALLTIANITRRFALRGVWVEGSLDGPVLVAGHLGPTLADAVRALGAIPGPPEPGVDMPTLAVGTAGDLPDRALTATFEGWRGGYVRGGKGRLGERNTVSAAAVLAAALASGEAFAMLRGEVTAGRRQGGLSLWRPDGGADWLSAASDGPPPPGLPDHLWVLGLGHLGQAFLWTLLLCPYRDPSAVRLVLQDDDIVTGSTDSTSILTRADMAGARKTRAVAEVLDGLFDRDRYLDPAALICGVDNALARSRLERPGFPLVVEAGIGATAADFRAIRVHSFPSFGKGADVLWGGPDETSAPDVSRPAYRRLAAAGHDPCGLARLAGTAVGAPFVGAVAGAVIMGQLLRVIAGDAPDMTVDLNLSSLRSRRAVPSGQAPTSLVGFQSLPCNPSS